jgi:hypothetical protein
VRSLVLLDSKTLSMKLLEMSFKNMNVSVWPDADITELNSIIKALKFKEAISSSVVSLADMFEKKMSLKNAASSSSSSSGVAAEAPAVLPPIDFFKQLMKDVHDKVMKTTEEVSGRSDDSDEESDEDED